MPWSTTRDVHRFAQEAGDYLSSQPVKHSVLLTETAYLQAIDSAADDQLFGWFTEAGVVTAAFVQAPRHPPVVTPQTPPAVRSLADVLPHLEAIGVDARDIPSVRGSWQRVGITLEPRSRINVHRLGHLRKPLLPEGEARVARVADHDLLVAWFDQLIATFPEDPSDVAYVVADPLSYGGITLWQINDR